MSDKDQQDTQSKNVLASKNADIEKAIDPVEDSANKNDIADDVGAENYSLSLDDSVPVENLPNWAREDQQAKEAPRDDPLAWIDSGETGSSVTEMPTLQYPGERAHAPVEEPDTPVKNPNPGYLHGFDKPQPLENFDDAMAWLDKLAASKGQPVEELPTQIIAKDLPVDYLNRTDENHNADPDPDMEIIDDPISWLEQLAADQDTPLEELPSVADRLLASEIISKIDDSQGTAVPQVDPPEVAVPLEDALLYLEQIAQDEGIQLQTVEIDPNIDTRDLDALLLQVDQLAAGDISGLPLAVMAATTAAERKQPNQSKVDWNNLSDTMPEDPDEALAWMESLAAAADDDAGADAVPETTASDLAELDTLPPKTVGTRNEEDYLEDMPEDPDEVMAYLERVSADKGQESVDSAVSTKPEAASQPQLTEVEPPAQKENSALAEASQALAEGNIDKALVGYKALLAQGDDLNAVVAELETAVVKNPKIGRLRYLLGDAYMKNGQHQEALKAYQQGSLDNL